MNNKNIAIVFDLDGTLLDTLTDLTNSVNYAMQQLSLPTYSANEVRQMIGNGVVVLMQRALKEQHQNLHSDALKFQREFYSTHSMDNTKPYDGILPMLQQLKSLGVTIVVHTNKDENVAQPLCKQVFGNNVDFVCGTVDKTAIKPNAERLCALLAKLNVTKALYCGDSDVDIQTAANANLPCISVTWGFRDKDFLAEHGAKNFAETPFDIITYVKNNLLS